MLLQVLVHPASGVAAIGQVTEVVARPSVPWMSRFPGRQSLPSMELHIFCSTSQSAPSVDPLSWVKRLTNLHQA